MRTRVMHGRVVLAISMLSLAAPTTPVAQAASEQPSVDTIVEKTNCVAYYNGKDGRAQVSMTITDSQGRTRKRRFIMLRRDEEPTGDTSDKVCAEQTFYIYFHRPADINKTVFMVWKHTDRDDDRWLYLPALDLVKRIAASDERTSFVGSHFFYEDVSGRGITEDTHELVETTKNYYVLKNTPKNPHTVEFVSFTMWIHRKTFIPVKIEYYDKQGEKYRVYEALKVETIEGYPTIMRSRMRDLRRHGETVITYSNVTYNLGLPEGIFTERYLRHPPKKYLR